MVALRRSRRHASSRNQPDPPDVHHDVDRAEAAWRVGRVVALVTLAAGLVATGLLATTISLLAGGLALLATPAVAAGAMRLTEWTVVAVLRRVAPVPPAVRTPASLVLARSE